MTSAWFPKGTIETTWNNHTWKEREKNTSKDFPGWTASPGGVHWRCCNRTAGHQGGVEMWTKCLGNAYCSKSLNLQNGYCIPIDIYVYISYTVRKQILSNSIYTMMFIFVVLGTILFFQPYPNKSMKWQMSFEPRNCWKVLHQDSESAAQLPLTSEALMTWFSETLQV